MDVQNNLKCQTFQLCTPVMRYTGLEEVEETNLEAESAVLLAESKGRAVVTEEVR